MYAVIFEVYPRKERYDDYLNIAASLGPELEKIDGFISIERFSSLVEEGKVLSLSFWRDEGAVKELRGHMEHRAAQRRGRQEIFTNYRLRVMSQVRDYGMFDRDQAPQKLPHAERVENA